MNKSWDNLIAEFRSHGGIADNSTYYSVEATTANGLADNQIKLATSLANANLGTTISFT